MRILLTDEEIKQAIVGADKEIWSFKAHPRWEGEKYLLKVQLKKVYEWLGLPENRLQPDSDLSLVDRTKLKKEIKE